MGERVATSLGITFVMSLWGFLVPAEAADNGQKLEDALIIEWAVAHCEEQIPAMAVMYAGMVINGSDASNVARTRSAVHKMISERFKDTEAACVKVNETVSQSLPPAMAQ